MVRPHQLTFVLLILASVVLAFPASADFSGRVVGVTDGATISVLRNGKAERVRLNGIDCPEKGQAFGQRAKQFTSQLAFGKEVTVKVFGHDKYGRTIGDVMLPDGRSLNQEPVRAGLAWWYRKYASENATLATRKRDHGRLRKDCGRTPRLCLPGSIAKQDVGRR